MIASLTLLTGLIVAVSAADYSICDAYTKLEAAAPCGSDGYALNFGFPICKKFIDNESQFNERGRAFLDCVRPCLANFVSANITGKDKDCSAIKDAAFASHTPCYDKCDFCGVALSNFWQFARTFKLSNFLSRIAMKQVLQVALKCARSPSQLFSGR